MTLALGELTEDAAPGGGDSQQPPEMSSDGQTGDQPTGTPPEKPEDTSGDNQSGQQPPEKPDGDSSQSNDNQPPDMPEGGMGGSSFTESGETLTIDISDAAIVKNDETVSATELSVDDVVQVTFDDSGSAATVEIVSGSMGGGFGGSNQVTQGSSANTISEDGTYTDTTYTSPGDDENALRVDGATVTLDGITVDKSAGATSNTENGDFYGVNAALLATNGATVTITNATVTSSAQNGNGVFSYGTGTTVNISESMITTTADNQTLSGDIVVDTISTLNMKLTGGSTFTGTINIVDNAQNGTAVSNNAVVTIESGCTWTLTGDCVITSLTNSGTINFNGYTITLADGTVLR